MEYPEEIIYKINQFYNETIFNIDNIKSIVNYIYSKRIKYIIKSTNIYINNFIKNDINYIKANINSSNIFDHFYLIKFEQLDDLYNNCISNNDINAFNDTEISIFDEQNYINKINSNLDYINDFILFLENEIEQFFLSTVCENNTGPFNNETICRDVQRTFNPMYSKYNYNIVKLRNGIYYTKTLLENINLLFDEYNFINIIDNNKIELYDELLNDKNILYIYNKTNHKIIEINKESENIMYETYQYFIDDFKSKYSFKNDYLPFDKIFKEIIKMEHDDYNNTINNTVNIIIDNIIPLMNEFNKTLIEQLSLRDKYTYNNFNREYFKNIFLIYNTSLENMFELTRENITNLTYINTYIFYNSFKTILSKLQLNKRNYFKKIINDFAINYDYELLNISFNLGERIEYFLEKEYADYEFTFIYDYVETFENYTIPYINKIIENINYIENLFSPIFENIYNDFYHEFESNSSSFIDLKFIENLENNQTKCLKYINYTNINITNK